jgi:hypothetical protein
VRIYFYSLRVRSASLAELRMRICYQNNGGSSISKRENNKLWRDFSPNCAPVSLGERKLRSYTRGATELHLLDAHPTAYGQLFV